MAWVKISTDFRCENVAYPASKRVQDIPDHVAELAESEGWAKKAKAPVKNKMKAPVKNK